jgi:hypothetical protein
MPQRPLITFEYVIQNFDDEQDVDMVNTGHIQSGPNNTSTATTTTELNNNHIVEQNNGLHQIKIVRSNSNVGGGGENPHRQNYLTNIHQHQQPYNYNNQTKNNISTTEIWHHGPR